MPGTPRPVADERDALLTFLGQQRHLMRVSVHGITDDQARQTPSVSTLSLGGLLKHVAYCERGWTYTMLQRGSVEVDYMEQFRFGPDETLASVLELYDEVARETEEAVAGIEDLGRPVPIPRDQPWFPDEYDEWSVRWVLLHQIEETAKHAGHADIIRESLDRATFFPLLADYEDDHKLKAILAQWAQ